MAKNEIKKIGNKKTLSDLLNREDIQKSIRDIAPRHLTINRIMKMLLIAASRQPKLFECTQESFLQSSIRSVELGLDCSGSLGQAYLVPYWNSKINAREATFIPGYQGLCELARRTGRIRRIEARVVYEKDEFDVSYGLDQKLVHKPKLDGQRGKLVCCYAIAEFKDSSKQLEIMTKDQIDGIHNRSKAKDSGPWKTDYTEMARKTVVRRLVKYLPKSPELEKAMEADNEQYEFNAVSEQAETEQQKQGTKAVKTKIKNQAQNNENKEPKEKEQENEIEENKETANN